MKACIACKHFEIDLGEHGYSTLTPGRGGSVTCAMNKFPRGMEGEMRLMPDLVDKANGCDSYSITDDAKQRGFTA